jgi:hypothetical protein
MRYEDGAAGARIGRNAAAFLLPRLHVNEFRTREVTRNENCPVAVHATT